MQFPQFFTRTLDLDFGRRAVDTELPGASADAWSDAGAGFSALLAQVLDIALVIGGIAVLFYLVWGAVEWITAGGDKSKTEKARDKITQSVVGLILLVSTTAIMLFVQQLIGICIVDIGGLGCKNPASGGGGGGGGGGSRNTCTQTCVSASIECSEGGGTIVGGTCSGSVGLCCDFP